MEFSWVGHGVDLRTARGAVDSDFVRLSTSANMPPAAHRADSPLAVAGLVAQLDGAHTPVVGIADLPRGPSNAFALRTGWLYGRIVSPVRLERFAGRAERDDWVRVPPIVLEEEL